MMNNGRTRRAVRLFLASPCDTSSERSSADRVVAEINQTVAPSLGIVIELVRWEHVPPGMGRPQQVVLDHSDIDDCDLFVGILWNRFGTPTGKAESGTQEEFIIAYEAWLRRRQPEIMFYFCQQPANLQTEYELAQKLKVIQFRESLSNKGLFVEYATPESFEMLFRQHLIQHLLSRLAPKFSAGAGPTGSEPAAPKPGSMPRGADVFEVPAGMVCVPAGRFYSGVGRREVVLDYDFYIDETPVTNAEFASFLSDSHYLSYVRANFMASAVRAYEAIMLKAVSMPDHPVVFVSWFDALTYATWFGKRLPTAAEWEKAARGEDGRIFPWGDEFDAQLCNSAESALGTTTPVRTYLRGISPYGCFDMAGNVFEWVSNWADRPRHSNLPNSEKVNCNGSFNRPSEHMACWYTESDPPASRMGDVGFRCVFVPSEIRSPQQRRLGQLGI